MIFVTFGIALGYRLRPFGIILGCKTAKFCIDLGQKLRKKKQVDFRI